MEHELALLSLAITSPDSYYLAKEKGVSEQSFTGCHGAIWKAIQTCMDKGAADRYAVLSLLRRNKTAMQVVDGLPSVAPDTLHVHLDGVRHEEKSRRLRAIIDRYSLTSGNPDEIAQALAIDALDVLRDNDTHRAVTPLDVVDSIKDKYRDIYQGTTPHIAGFDSWVHEVNGWAVPYVRGKVTGFAAYRNLGKSQWAKQEILHLAMQGVKCGLVSMEDDKDDILASMATLMGAGYLWQHQQGKGHYNNFAKNLDYIKSLPIYIVDSPQTINQLETTLTMLAAKGCEFIAIDYLQMIHGERGVRYGNIDDRYTTYMESITSKAKSLNVAMLLLTQLSRDSEKEERRPRLSDCKGSSSIEQMLRRIYMMWRDPTDGSFILEGTKISVSGRGTANDRQVHLEFEPDHDGFKMKVD